ncbi:MAG: hypothetical protein JXR72_05845 [Proteobacteria bacterium]|nr:hypothetical protein [Pseudomonadota bacterium]
MSARRLLWKVLPAYILVISFALAGFAWFGAAHISRYFYEETKKDLEAVAWMAASRIGINGPEWQTDEASLLTLNHWCRSFSTRTGLHLRVVLPEGKLV